MTRGADYTYRVARRGVDASQWRTLTPVLEVGDVTTSVTVVAEASAIETSQANTAAGTKEQTIQQAPLIDRNLLNLALMVPGVVGYGNRAGDNYNNEQPTSMRGAGQRAEANNYVMDGATLTGDSRGGQTTINPKPDTIAEMKVAVNQFSAEKGRSSGMVVEFVSKSGTNEWHGSLYEYHTNDRLNSRAIQQVVLPKSRPNLFGGTAGGPIARNRTFAFGSLERLLSSAPQTTTPTVETPQFRDFVQRNYPDSIAARVLRIAPPAANSTLDSRNI